MPEGLVADILASEGVVAVVGSGRSGKTAFAHLMLANANRPVILLDYPEELVQRLCPEGWTTCVPEEVFGLKDCILVVDDAALSMSSRDYSNDFQRAFIRFQTIISHKSMTVVYIVQNLQLLDIGILRSQRLGVLYKYSNENNIRFERDEYKSTAAMARHLIKIGRSENPLLHEKSFIYDDTSGRVWSHPMANHWCDELSKPYRDYIVQVKI